MRYLLEQVLLVLIVGISAIYVVYALSPVSFKRIMLSWLIRCCGLRVYAWLSPRVGGCTQCATDLQKRSVVRQFQQAKAPSKITTP
jgi:hypothetical protein